jgi:hypothetical protein
VAVAKNLCVVFDDLGLGLTRQRKNGLKGDGTVRRPKEYFPFSAAHSPLWKVSSRLAAGYSIGIIVTVPRDL